MHTKTAHSDNPGTPYYQAPEVSVEGRRAQPYSDVWSASLVGTEWFTGRKSWKSTGRKAFFSMKEKRSMPTHLSKVPDGVREVLTAGLSYNAKERPDASHVKNALGKYSGIANIVKHH